MARLKLSLSSPFNKQEQNKKRNIENLNPTYISCINKLQDKQIIDLNLIYLLTLPSLFSLFCIWSPMLSVVHPHKGSFRAGNSRGVIKICMDSWHLLWFFFFFFNLYQAAIFTNLQNFLLSPGTEIRTPVTLPLCFWCLHYLLSLLHGHKKMDKEKKNKNKNGLAVRMPDSASFLWKKATDFPSCFWYCSDHSRAVEFTPPPTWFVNTCVCTLLLWATGKETYIVFMRIKTKSNAKKKLLLKKKKAHVFLNVPIFLSKCILFFWKSINYCCTLLLWWQNNRKAQSVFAGCKGGGRKSQNEWVLAPGRTLAHRDPCTHVVR